MILLVPLATRLSFCLSPRATEGLSILGHGLAALGAGWTVCAIITPFENLKAKLQMQTTSEKKLYSGPLDAARQTLKVQLVLFN